MDTVLPQFSGGIFVYRIQDIHCGCHGNKPQMEAPITAAASTLLGLHHRNQLIITNIDSNADC